MKNIHLIPTDKPSKIALSFEKLFFNSKPLSPILYKNQNICITNDEEIKDGDWCYYENGDLKGIHKVINGKIPKTMFLKKIILTTDQDLIKDGVQAISDEFIELFVKNLNCERVEIRDYKLHFGSTIYKIIIPQEEPKQSNNFYEELKHYFETTPREKVLEDWNKSAEFDKIGPTVEEFLGMIQETIEEAAEKYGKQVLNDRKDKNLTLDEEIWLSGGSIVGFKDGAKWQAERMYSEEEIAIAFNEGQAYSVTGKLVYGNEWVKTHKKEWFEEVKKK